MLSWFLLAAALVVLPVALRLWAEDGPANDEPASPAGDREPDEPLLAAA